MFISWVLEGSYALSFIGLLIEFLIFFGEEDWLQWAMDRVYGSF